MKKATEEEKIRTKHVNYIGAEIIKFIYQSFSSGLTV